MFRLRGNVTDLSGFLQAVSRPDNDEKTDNDVSEIKPDSRLPAAEFRRSSVNRNKTPDIIIEKERGE